MKVADPFISGQEAVVVLGRVEEVGDEALRPWLGRYGSIEI